MTLEWIGLLGSLALLVVLTMRGVDLLLAAPVCALLLALSFGLPLVPQLAAAGAENFTSAYMTGFSGFIASWFFVFLLGSVIALWPDAREQRRLAVRYDEAGSPARGR